jgi:hypothetical protein
MKSIKRPTLAILAIVFSSMPAAHAAMDTSSAQPNAQPSALPSAQSSAAPGPSDGAQAIATGMAVSAYAWPKEASDKPKEADWAGATMLESINTVALSDWRKASLTCRQWALREWIRIECSPPGSMNSEFLADQRFFGSLWGLAGDISNVSGQFKLVSEIDYLSKATDQSSISGRLTRAMAAKGTITFQAKYGSATMLRMDEIFWAEQYDGGGNVLLAPGIIVDISWALGEKYPSVILRG